MGLEFIREQRAGFETQVDDCLSRELDTDLLSGASSDESIRVFRCVLSDPSIQVQGGGNRLIIRGFSDGSLKVLQASNVIGHVHADDLGLLISLMRKNKTHTSVLSVLVVDQPDISGEFTVRPVKPFKHN